MRFFCKQTQHTAKTNRLEAAGGFSGEKQPWGVKDWVSRSFAISAKHAKNELSRARSARGMPRGAAGGAAGRVGLANTSATAAYQARMRKSSISGGVYIR